jgi:ribonuclease BN (tRNA processing enzyme)
MGSLSSNPEAQPFFIPPAFGVTVLGSSHGFDSKGSTSGYVLWIGRRGIMIDPPPYSSSVLEKQQIHPSVIDGVLLTHCHADHDAGTFQKLLCEKRITLYTT